MTTALYGRVSSDKQEQEETILSQLAELRERAQEDSLSDWQEFVDEGYGRDNLVRPSLDRLRDLVAQGEVERLYVQAPDRLASGAKLVLLVEEFRQHRVEVVFLKGSVEDIPEGKLLLHMQGAMAEYERTKIAERTRRGKLYWARQSAMVGGHAPYGYRFVRRTDAQRARLEVSEYAATVVRKMYRLLTEEQYSTRAIARHLTEQGIPTARGAVQWQPMAVDRILRNTVYMGTFYYQRNESVEPSKRLTNDPYRRSRKTGRKPRPREDWIAIPVPVIVPESLWDAAQEQLHQNSLHSPRNNKRHQYLLRGLVRCPRCSGSYTGYVQHGYRGYRCNRVHSANSSTGQRCPPGAFSAEPVEDAVWEAVTDALQHPEVLVEEYRALLARAARPESVEAERKQTSLALKRVKAQEDRVTDAYINEAMDLDRYKAEMDKLGQRRKELERAAQDITRREQQERDSRKGLEHLERFCQDIDRGLEAMTFDERQHLLRLVIEGITVENGNVRIETVIPMGSDDELRIRRGELVEPSWWPPQSG